LVIQFDLNYIKKKLIMIHWKTTYKYPFNFNYCLKQCVWASQIKLTLNSRLVIVCIKNLFSLSFLLIVLFLYFKVLFHFVMWKNDSEEAQITSYPLCLCVRTCVKWFIFCILNMPSLSFCLFYLFRIILDHWFLKWFLTESDWRECGVVIFLYIVHEITLPFICLWTNNNKLCVHDFYNIYSCYLL